MADINQRLGFDASAAITSLNNLSVALANVNTQIAQLNAVARGNPLAAMTASSAQAAANLARVNTQVTTLNTNLTQLGLNGGQAVNNINLGFGSLATLVGSQVIFSGIRALVSDFLAASEAAREFQLTIARSSTIANGAGGSIAELSASVRQLAIDAGLPLKEVSVATFEALQNEVGTTAETINFLGVASQLAVAQGSKLETAVNSLTSIMKSYGETADTAAKNSDTLFVAVDQGRLTLSELENRLGTINPLAAELGLSFTQTAAASASLTQTGLNTATATTQLRNVLTKLLDPTKELQRAFKELGVASGQELVATFGGSLPAALNALKSKFGESEAALANAFGTIRGQLGVLNLFANDTKILNGILAEFDKQAGRAADAFNKVDATNARAYEKELAKLEVTMEKLGETALVLKTQVLSIFNGLGNSPSLFFGIMAAGAVTVAAASTSIVGSITSIRLALTALATSTPLAAIVGLFATVVSAQLADIFQTGKSVAQSALEEAARLNSEAATLRKQSLDEQTKALVQSTNEQATILETLFVKAKSLYAEDAAAFEASNDRIVLTSTRVAESFISGRESLLKGLDSFIAGVDGRIKDSTDKVKSAFQSLEDFNFAQQTKGLNEAQKAFAQLQRAQQALSNAGAAANSAGVDVKSQEQARQVLAIAKARAEEALRTAESSKNQGAINQAVQLYRTVLQQNAKFEQDNIKKLSNLDKIRFGEQRDELARLTALEKEKVTTLAGLNSNVDSSGRQKGQSQFEADAKAAQALVKELIDIRSQISNIGVIDQAGLRDLSDKTSAAFEFGISKANFDFRNAVVQLQEQLSKGKFQITVDALRGNLSSGNESIQKILTEAASQATAQGITDPLGVIKVQKQALVDFQLTQAQSAATQKELTSNINAGIGAINGLGEAAVQSGGFLERLKQGAQGFVLSDFLNIPNENIIAKLGNDALKLQSQIGGVANGLATGTLKIEEATKQAELLRQKFEQIRTSGDVSVGNADQISSVGLSIQELDGVIAKFKELRASQSADNAAAAAEAGNILNNITTTANVLNTELGAASQTAAQINVNNLNQSVLNAIANIRTMNQELASGGGSPQSRHFGGPVFRATGGDLTRGSDNQLVAAQAGEFITNPASSSRFFAQLRAINAGQAPVFRENGGPVTNVGDINVNISQSSGQAIDGRQLASSLRRELRQNTNSLRRG